MKLLSVLQDFKQTDVEEVLTGTFQSNDPIQLTGTQRFTNGLRNGLRKIMLPLRQEAIFADTSEMALDTRPLVAPTLVEGGRTSSAADARLWPVAKRVFDVIVTVTLLIVSMPLLILIAGLVKFDSPGPVIFRQRRYGRGLEPFTVWKFRTMHDGASPEAHRRYIAALAAGTHDGKAGLKKLIGDPRVTRLGAVLRRTSLDELPQLVNVLRGDMSIVGPRPALEYELEHYAAVHFDRFLVRPGLTGLWQVSGRSLLGFEDMLDLDVTYARDCGPGLDAVILLRTPRAVLVGRAA